MPCMSAFEICCCVADSVIQTIMLLTSKLMKCKWNNTRRHVVWFFLFWYLFVVLWKNNRCNIKMFYDDISSINQLLNYYQYWHSFDICARLKCGQTVAFFWNVQLFYIDYVGTNVHVQQSINKLMIMCSIHCWWNMTR